MLIGEVCIERVINDGHRIVQIGVHDTGHGISADAPAYISLNAIIRKTVRIRLRVLVSDWLW